MHSCCMLTACRSPPIISSTRSGTVKREAKILATQQHGQASITKTLVVPFMAAILAFSPLCSAPASLGQTTQIQKGATLFRTSCIGCHDGGGNILQPGATLFGNDLERNGVSTEESIYEITYYGKGRMPGFGEKCTPRGQCTFGARLQDDEIKLLAMFVKSQAEQGWPNIEIYKD
ncbi:cytochrome c6, chloroplastic-like [Nymphaea colorata]|nr:cytochrome c6, chloroplastic-like [Nymphaea colorata]